MVIEGIFALNMKSDLKVFIDSSKKKRRERRIRRDMAERGRTRESVIEQLKTVEKMYIRYVLPTRKKADIVIRN